MTDQSPDTPRPRTPCPRCGKGCGESATYFADEPDRMLQATELDIVVLACKDCRVMGVKVEGVADILWREAGPGLKSLLVADAVSGIRLHRMWHSDSNDPIWQRR